MTISLGWLRKRVFGIAPAEATFSRRGFQECSFAVRQHLENIGLTFVQGYNAALEDDRLEELTSRLNAVENESRGFAFEGAAMALTMLDRLALRRKDRFQQFLKGPANSHIYMAHVGAGWAVARLHLNIEKVLARLDSLLRWLVIDGYGFHEGYFNWRHYLIEKSIPKNLSGYACRVFDQGLGRSLWFIKGADVSRIVSTIITFPQTRQGDLWSGVGLASVYAGGTNLESLNFLRRAAGVHMPHLAQGAAFAAKARERAGNLTTHTESACQILCGLPAQAAAIISDVALKDLVPTGSEPEYETWRLRIQSQFRDV